MYFSIDLLCSFLYVTLNTTAGTFCPRTFFTRCTPSRNMTKKGNIILSSHVSCQYPDQFPAQSAYRTAGSRQYQKQLVELVPCPLVPPWGATGIKKIFNVGPSIISKSSSLEKKPDQVKKISRKLSSVQGGVSQGPKLLGHVAWGMTHVRVPFSFQVLCPSSLYFLPFSLNL